MERTWKGGKWNHLRFAHHVRRPRPRALSRSRRRRRRPVHLCIRDRQRKKGQDPTAQILCFKTINLKELFSVLSSLTKLNFLKLHYVQRLRVI